jgi:hypothetical protein
MGKSLTSMRKWVLVSLIAFSILVAAVFGWLRYISKDARRWDSAQVTVTYRGAAECSVALRGSVDRHAMPCVVVANYFRNQLKLSTGAKYVIYDMSDSDKTGVKDLRLRLDQNGYVAVGMLSAVIHEPGR